MTANVTIMPNSIDVVVDEEEQQRRENPYSSTSSLYLSTKTKEGPNSDKDEYNEEDNNNDDGNGNDKQTICCHCYYISWSNIKKLLFEFYAQYELLILVLIAIGLAKLYPPLGAEYLQPQITSTWIAVFFIFGKLKHL
jgi:hypothetical protein